MSQEREARTGVAVRPEPPGGRLAQWRKALWAAACVTGLLQAWAYRHNVSSDGISYLDIARNCVQGDWHSLVNGYWSPLYPFVLSVFLRVFKPSPYWESTVTHLANLAIFVAALLCFEAFLKSLLGDTRRSQPADAEQEALPEWALWALGDSLFVLFMLLFIGLERVQPDMCVAGLVFAAAAILLRIRSDGRGWASYGALGAVLGIGYLAKAIMFPLSFVFLACCLFAAGPLRRAIPRTAFALVIFSLVASPFAFALSQAKGRITVGDTGGINYAEFVDGVTRYIHWQGGPTGAGMPVHPTRLLIATPPLFEFAAPIRGTYPPWYDPSYWYEGVVPRFSLRNQLRAIRYTIEEYVSILPYMSGVFVCFLAMAWFAGARSSLWTSLWKGLLRQWPIWMPGLAALGLYGLLYVEARFVAPFFVLIWMGLFVGLRFPKSQVARVLTTSLTIATVLMLSVGIAWLAGRSLFRALAPQTFTDWQVAEELHKMGIQSGESVGSMGAGLYGYWAHLAGVRIVAEIPAGGVSSYWIAPPEIQSEILQDFAGTGARVVVLDAEPPGGPRPDWKRIGGTGYFVHDLRAMSPAHEPER